MTRKYFAFCAKSYTGDNSDTENENDGEETTEEGNRAAVQEN